MSWSCVPMSEARSSAHGFYLSTKKKKKRNQKKRSDVMWRINSWSCVCLGYVHHSKLSLCHIPSQFYLISGFHDLCSVVHEARLDSKSSMHGFVCVCWMKDWVTKRTNLMMLCENWIVRGSVIPDDTRNVWQWKFLDPTSHLCLRRWCLESILDPRLWIC